MNKAGEFSSRPSTPGTGWRNKTDQTRTVNRTQGRSTIILQSGRVRRELPLQVAGPSSVNDINDLVHKSLNAPIAIPSSSECFLYCEIVLNLI